ncbi:MAG: hypothetical protein HYV60_15445 [Planctomycetia bacterium]|nr:hypothetical protein [Planctomycetia bacterium]
MLTHAWNLRKQFHDAFLRDGIRIRFRHAWISFTEIFGPARARPRRRRHVKRRRRLAAESLEPRAMLSGNAFSFDDFPDAGQWSVAAEIAMEPNRPTASVGGRLETRLDTDLFQFVAPMSGRAVLRLKTPASPLDPHLFVYDASNEHHLLASNDDYCRQDSKVTLRVQEGERYFVLTDNYRDGSIGSYMLDMRVIADDHADLGQWSAASEVLIEPVTGDGSAVGSLEQPGDTDLFRFVAVATGQATIRLDTPESELNPVLYVARDESSPVAFTATANEAGEPVLHTAGGWRQPTVIAGNNDHNGLDPQVTIDVIEGETYFVLADSFRNRSAGAYTLSVDMPPVDDHPDFGDSDSTEILMDPATGNGSIAGTLERPGDNDLFRFVASTTGQAVIRLDAAHGHLNTHLFVGTVTPTPQLLGQNRNADGTGSQVTINVTAGQTYFIVAAGAENRSTGTYRVSVTVEAEELAVLRRGGRQPARSPGGGGMAPAQPGHGGRGSD